MNLVTVTAAEP